MQHDAYRRLSALGLVIFPIAAWLIVAHYYWRISGPLSYWRLAVATPSQSSLLTALSAGFVVALVLLAFAFRNSNGGFAGAPYNKLLRGPRLVSQKRLAWLTRVRGALQVMIAGVWMPLDAETRHLLLVGATGVGKSTYMRELIKSILRRAAILKKNGKKGDRLVIADPDGMLYAQFGTPNDTILNPHDKRSPGWSIYNEFWDLAYDIPRFTKSLIPLGATAEEELWCGYARDLLATIIKKQYITGNTSIDSLFETAASIDKKKLGEFLEGTNEASMFTEGLEKMLGGIRATIKRNLLPHLLMPAGDFSLRKWLSEGEGNLYITWRESMLESLAPLNGAWLDIICAAILDVPEKDAKPLWVCLGELGSMGKLASLLPALTKGRKHGLRAVIELQATSQARKVYGDDDSQTMLSNIRSSVVFASSSLDTDTLDAMSMVIGEHNVERKQVSTSHGQNKSKSESTQIVSERLVSPAEISMQEDLTGILTFPGAFPRAHVVVVPRNFPIINEAFVDA